MGIYEDIRKALQDLIVPEIKTLHVEIKRLDEKIDNAYKNLRAKMDNVEQRVSDKTESLEIQLSNLKTHLSDKEDSLMSVMMSEIRRVDSSIEGLRKQLDTAIEIRERLASLEARVGIGTEVV